MTTQQFKTTIKCGACVATVTPYLNDAEGIGEWKVDLQSPDRILTVQTDKAPAEVAELVKAAGYQAEPIQR